MLDLKDWNHVPFNPDVQVVTTSSNGYSDMVFVIIMIVGSVLLLWFLSKN